MKKCQKCREEKEFGEFGRLRSSKDGFRPICRQCRKIYFLKPHEQVEKWNERRKIRMREMGLQSKGRTVSPEGRKNMSIAKAKIFENHDYEPACVNRVLHRYKKRGITLNIEEFKKYIYDVCFYCGSKPSSKSYDSSGKRFIEYNGLDRVDNIKGYSLENIVTCCTICNKAKHTMTFEDFKNWIIKVHNNLIG